MIYTRPGGKGSSLAGILLGSGLALMAGLAVLRVAPALPESILLAVITAGFMT
ncbi:hypothetical protein [Moorella sp. E306M]|uniref:hypothetical protein n=1 Tax=Moorella sp. E306M TaxID=2572683 RepID=UPI00155A6CB0|nr:hypothetical protein [Moorella sp. E306M]